jgi:hypothetical protein
LRTGERLRLGLLVAATAIPLSFASTTSACVVWAPVKRIEGVNYDAKVIVRATEASYYEPEPTRPDVSRSWSAKGRLLRVIEGVTDVNSVTFWMGQSSACEEEYPIPIVGERWVVYLMLVDQRFVHVGSYPLKPREPAR